jgi:hypothetical protein
MPVDDAVRESFNDALSQMCEAIRMWQERDGRVSLLDSTPVVDNRVIFPHE